MLYENRDNLPQEVKDKMPQGAQQIFMTAANSAASDGLGSEQAQQVAWDTIRQAYDQDENGNWRHKAEGGSDRSPLGSMGGA